MSAPILRPISEIAVPEDYPFDGFTDEQKDQFGQVKEHIAKLFDPVGSTLTGNPLPGETNWANDECIVRYLKSTKFDTNKACINITKTLQWRRDYRPTEISPQEIEEEAKNGKAFFHGFDRLNRPIFILNSAITYSKDPERYLRFILFNLERGTALCPRGVWQVCAIADVEGVTMFNQNPLSITTRLADVFSAHYPERLGWICIMNPSWALWVLAKFLLPFIDPVTKAKINLSYKGGKAKAIKKTDAEEAASATVAGTGGFVEDLSHLMDVDTQLSIALGGKCEYTYDHGVYWPEFLKCVGLGE